MQRARLLVSIGLYAALGFAIIAGCRTAIDQSPLPQLTKTDQATTIHAALAKAPIVLTPGIQSQRLDFIDVSQSMPVGQDLAAALNLNPDSVSVNVQLIKPGEKVPAEPTIDIVLTLGDDAGSVCDTGASVGRITIGVDQQGGLLSMASQGAVLGGSSVDALRAGKVVLCARAVSNFAGTITLGEVLIDAAAPPIELPARDGGIILVSVGGDDNSNDNTADDNADDVGDDNGNDNADDLGDDNGNDNADDVGDDNGNDNGADDIGDDNGNDNGTGDVGDDDSNDNTDDNGNDNGADDVGDDNGNDNTDDDNGNDNVDDNGNDNANPAGPCPNGEFRLRIDDLAGPGGEELEAEYRLLPGGCERFRVRIEDMAAGTYDVTINGVVVGQIVIGADGEGELEFDTEDGNFPLDFPEVHIDDVLGIGSTLTGALPLDCSHETHVCPGV